MTVRIPDDVEVDARLAAIRSRLLAAVGHERTPRYSRARKAGITAVTASGLALLLTGGTIAIIQATQEQIGYSVECYETASLSADFTTVARPTATDNQTGEEMRDSTDPVTTCGEMWRMGLIGQDHVPADPNAAQFSVPEIVGCVLSNGIGAGFPREGTEAPAAEFCRDLGLATWTG